MVQRLCEDVRHGVRFLRTSPGLCLTAAVLVALVVGGNTTIYSMVNGAIRRPAPGVTADGIVSFGLVGRPGAPYFAYGDYSQYAAQTTSLRSLAAWGFSRVGISTPDGNFLQQVTPVTRNYFDTIGIVAAKGRLFQADDDRPGAPLVAVVNDGIWRSRFHAAEDVVGRRITINGRPATIVGVTPPRFGGPSSGEWSDLWVPLHSYQRVEPTTGVAMIGRLAPGSSIARAQAEFSTMQARLAAVAPLERERAPVLVTRYAASAGGVLPAFEREILAIFSIVTLLTLAVVCANVANLMLGRTVIQQRETAVRQSLGASRGRIVRLIVVEGLVIAGVACVLALVVASWTASLVPALLPQGRVTMPLDFTPDWRVAVYAGVLTLLGTLLFSLVPALRAWRQDPLPQLKEGAHTTAFGRSRLSSGLVVLQLAFSVLLLTCAGLAYRSGALMQVDLGFDTKNILVASIGTAPSPSEDSVLLLERVRARFAALPNVTAVGYVGGPGGNWNQEDVTALESGNPVRVTIGRVGPGYLETLGVRPVAGRTISAADRRRAGGAAVIEQRVADALFSGRNALGQTLLVGRNRRPVEVVGIVPNAFYRGFDSERPDRQPHYVFVASPADIEEPVEDANWLASTSYYLRYTGPLESVVAAVPAAVREAAPQAAFAGSTTLDAQMEENSLTARMISILLGAFAAVSLLIAAVGQYAVVAFNMRRRTRDFGVRIALGASGRQIVSSVLGEGVGLTVVGLTAGFVLSAAVATALSGVLFGVTPTDGRTYAGAFGLLACVSLFASYLPARRASRIDPVQALRQE